MVSTVESCLDLLQKSDLLTPEQLAQARQSANECDDPKALLRRLVQQGLLTRWQAEKLLTGASVFTLGKYKLLDLLGRGGGGSVFVAQHTTMNRRVALKTIPKQLDRDSPLLERFLVEARAIASLDHPNIVHAYNLDIEDDRYFMVLELVEGRDLQRMVEADGPLDYSRAADYIRQAAEGLAHAHSRKMIHCDVKPSNLLVNPQGVIKILDLGMARLIGTHAEQGETPGQEERMLGTVDYVAPEQAMRSPDLDHRVDIYALGATLYFLLTGHAPFPGGSLAEKILKQQTAQPRSILEQRPGAPRGLVKICQKMMAKNPADRYQTAAEVAAVLAAWRPPKKVLKAVALDDADENRDGAFDLAALTASQRTGGAKPDSDKKLLGKSSGAGKKGPAKSDAAKPGAEAPPRPWYRRPMVLWAGGAVLVILGIVLGTILMMLNSEASTEQKPPEKTAVAASPTPAAPKPNKLVPKDNQEDLIPDLIPLDSGKKPKRPVKPPVKPPGDSGKPGEPVKVALAPPKELPKEEPKQPPKEPPKEAPKEPPKTSPESPPTPPPPKPEIKAPLAELPKAVDLPATDNTGPFAVGKISTPHGAAWELTLVGGETAFKNAPRLTRKLVLQEKDSGPDKPSWQVVLRETNAADESKNKEQVAARFFRDDDSLTFQWRPDAEPLATGALRYCALTVQVGEAKKTVGLIKPKLVKPLVIDLQKPVAQRKVEMDDVPQGKLWLEIVKLEGAKDFDKDVTVDVPKALQAKSRNKNLALSLKSHPIIKVDFPLMLVVNRTGFDVDLKVPKMPPQIAVWCKNPPADIEAAKKDLLKKRDEAHGKIEPAKTAKEKNIWTMQSNACDNMLGLLEFFDAVHNKVKIHFRVYLDAGDEQKIELATTEGP
jgi:serine/threonine protein kinase